MRYKNAMTWKDLMTFVNDKIAAGELPENPIVSIHTEHNGAVYDVPAVVSTASTNNGTQYLILYERSGRTAEDNGPSPLGPLGGLG